MRFIGYAVHDSKAQNRERSGLDDKIDHQDRVATDTTWGCEKVNGELGHMIL